MVREENECAPGEEKPGDGKTERTAVLIDAGRYDSHEREHAEDISPATAGREGGVRQHHVRQKGGAEKNRSSAPSAETLKRGVSLTGQVHRPFGDATSTQPQRRKESLYCR